MEEVREGLYYTKDHEWVKIEGPLTTIGITDHAQHSLGDITFVELPKMGASLKQSEQCATVESIKAASDIYAPLSGKVVKVNEALNSNPALINQDSYGQGWLAVIEIKDIEEKKKLLTDKDYTQYLEGLKK
ncbi:MAG: glycine cleavage system protein GcvH [Candidatus Omnitrophota bacterium]|nr:glycine cleavage system protein GcvH [Candidatus Omnitrophota bacterium]